MADTRANSIGTKRLNPTALRGKNDARKDLTVHARYSENVLKSQQTCSVLGNRQKLEKLILEWETLNKSEVSHEDGKECTSESRRSRLLGLMAVWNELTADAVGIDGKEYTKFFLKFDEALDIFYSFYSHIQKPYLNTDKDKFLYALLHAQWGLCVYIITRQETKERIILIRPDNVDMDIFLDFISQEEEYLQFTPRIQLDKWLVESILNTFDSEWDRLVGRVLLGLDRSRKELKHLGINEEDVSKNTEKVIMNK